MVSLGYIHVLKSYIVSLKNVQVLYTNPKIKNKYKTGFRKILKGGSDGPNKLFLVSFLILGGIILNIPNKCKDPLLDFQNSTV